MEKKVVSELIRIISACGVNRFLHSTQMYQKPSAIHVISLTDLSFLSKHREVLIQSKELSCCDFRSLCVMLWSILQDGDRTTADLLKEKKGGELQRSSEVHETTKDTASSGSWWSADYTHDNRGTILNAFQRTLLVARLLRTMLSPRCRKEVAAQFTMSPQDADRVLVLHSRVTQLYLLLAEALENLYGKKDAAPVPYDPELHLFFCRVEMCYEEVQSLLVELPLRAETDVAAVVRVFLRHHEVWEASGLSRSGTVTYLEAVHRLILTTMPRKAEVNELGDALSCIIVNRLLQRPPYRHHPFRMSEQFHRHQHEGPAAYYLSPTYGLQMMVWNVLSGLEKILFDDASASLAQVSRLTRQSFLFEMGKLQRSGRRLSYFQLLGVGIFQGMPLMNFDDSEELILRARATQLMNTTVAVPEMEVVFNGDFLRLLMAVSFTARPLIVSEEYQTPHVPLPVKALLPLFNSMARYIYQEPCFQMVADASAEGKDSMPSPSALLAPKFTPFRSPFDTSVLMRVSRLTELVTHHPQLQQAGKSSASVSPEVVSTVSSLQKRLWEVADRIYQGCRVAVKKSKSVLSFSVLSELVGVVCIALQRGIEHIVSHAIFPKSHLSALLDTTARLFAPFGPLVVALLGQKMEVYHQRFVVLMQRIPSVMRPVDVDEVFTKTLVPLVLPSMAVASPPRRRASIQAFQRKPLKTEKPSRELLEFHFLEAYLHAFSSAAAAFCVKDEHLLRHWADIGIACMTNVPASERYAVIANAAHNFFIAPFCSKRALGPLLVPSFVCALFPAKWNGYRHREPPLPLLQHFARRCRGIMQSILECDAHELSNLLQDPNSEPRRLIDSVTMDFPPPLPAPAAAAALNQTVKDPSRFTVTAMQRITPTNAALLLVSSVFEKICVLLHQASASHTRMDSEIIRKERWQRFSLCFGALANMIQCPEAEVVTWVCASIEAVLTEHMNRVPKTVVIEALNYVDTSVSRTLGPLKADLAQWIMALRNKIEKKLRNSKL